MRVAPDFLDVYFAITSTNILQKPNVSSVLNDMSAQGSLQGAVAAIVTETNVVGAVGGLNIPSISDFLVGFEAGAKYVSPDIKVLTTLTGSFDDAGEAKKVAQSMIDNGADIVMANADHAGLGVIEAAEQSGMLAKCSIGDQEELAPETVLVSGMAEMAMAFVAFVDAYLPAGDDFEADHFMMGVPEGIVYLSSFYDYESTDEQQSQIDDIVEGVKSGEIVVRDHGDFQLYKS